MSTSRERTNRSPAHAAGSAGIGSSVVVEDVDRGVRETFTLVTGPLLDLVAGQVSLASPIGQALLGTRAGAVVTVETPQRRRRLRVLTVHHPEGRMEQAKLTA